MRHRNYSLAAMLLAFVFIACACGSAQQQAPAANTPAAPSAPAANEAPASQGQQSQTPAAAPVGNHVNIKVGYSTNEEDPRGLASAMLKKIVEERSGGTITVEIYPSGQLGGDAALIEAMALDSGTVDLLISDCSNFATYEPKMGISAMPFMFGDFEDAWAFLDSDVLAEVEQLMLEHNIRVVGHYCNGFRCVTTSKNPVETPSDMNGMLIRTPENPVIMATMRALGANPQPLAFSELYMALQQGTYDAQENPIPVIYNNKLYEVQKGLSITNHIYSGMCVAIAESTWEKMSAEQQEIFAAAIKETETFNRETNRQMTNDYLEKLKAEGVNVATPDLVPFKEACQSVYDELSGNYGEELLAKVNEWLASR